MEPQEIPTRFAPSRRSPQDELQTQSRYFNTTNMFLEVANAVPTMLMVLNRNRQIVHANKWSQRILQMTQHPDLIGLRPGEAMLCAHASESEGGCGTTEFCKTCGSVRAILACQQGATDTQECRISRDNSLGPLDLRIVTTPITVNNEPFTVFAANDISNEKRREALERIFFHDVMNTAGALQGYLSLVDDASDTEKDEFLQGSQQLIATLIDEIQSQRELVDAERGTIRLDPSPLESRALLDSLAIAYRKHRVAESKSLVVDAAAETKHFTSDRRLLYRVLGNLIKNALEASAKEETVTIGTSYDDHSVEFWVHNPSVMPHEVQLQIFQRSFSTKGQGRGLGTYSIKLLGESYLGGAVAFTSTENKGTTFSLRLPLELMELPIQ